MTVTADPPISLADRFTVDSGKIYLTGVQALVRLPLVQRRNDLALGQNTGTFISGYPGSPLGGYDLELQRRRALLAEHHIVHTMGVNEELAATSVMGSQLAQQLPNPKYDGVVGLWYGKANGFDRAMDSLRQANLCGTTRTGGAVALVGDDPTAKSSPTPGASETAAAALMMPMLFPGDVQEVLDLGLHAIAMSRCTGLWTALKMSTQVADGSGSALVSMERVAPVMVEAYLDGKPYVHVPSSHLYGDSVLRLERSMVYARMEAALEYSRANGLNEITLQSENDRVGIVAPGKTYFELRQALRELGLDDEELRRIGVRLMQVRMPYPFDGRQLRQFASGLQEILVLEDKRPFLEFYIKDELYGLTDRPQVLGKLDEKGEHLVPLHHELDTASIARLVASRLRRIEELPVVEERLQRMSRRRLDLTPLTISRAPYFCSGCPHNSSAAAVPEGAIVGGGTGCHVLAVFMRPEDVGNIIGITAMGNEGAQWVGAAPFTELPHLIQNVGDGTFAHSGILAIRYAISAGVNITYKLLYNDHVAMTGAQPAIGIQAVPELVTELLAEGVKRVIITAEDLSRYNGVRLPSGVDVWNRDRMVEAQEVLRGVEGVTVIVHDQECAAEKRRKRKRGKLDDPPTRVVINESVCEGCGDCGVQSNCLSVHPVETEFGRKTQIHQPSCNKDYSCLKGNCPSFITVVPGTQKASRARLEDLDDSSLPEPEISVPTDEFGMRITGIGGTGVVTVAQTLAVAALLDGRFVRGLDQTGLAQKGGPVISDLKITRSPIDQANKLTSADCDLYLACDALAGSTQSNLAVAASDRTIAVVSTAQVPTGHMVVDTRTTYPDPAMLIDRISGASRRDRTVSLDAQAVSEQLFGSDQVANIMMVGAAYQAGALPLTAASIEQAIELNGVVVDMNIQAFRRGRQAVSDAGGLAAAMKSMRPADRPPVTVSDKARKIAGIVRAQRGSHLEHMVEVRATDLIAYQNARYAKRYAELVERLRAAEAAQVPGHSEVTEAAAFSLYKLMAYKDEYEVGRLHVREELRGELQGRFGPDVKYRFMLHPPILKALGMQRKIAIPGSVAVPMFRTLAKMKPVRGTKLDPFGRDHVRKVERQLVAEFEEVLERLATGLTPLNHETAVKVARLPDMIRGYDEVKMGNVDLYHEQLRTLLDQFSAGRTADAVSAASQ